MRLSCHGFLRAWLCNAESWRVRAWVNATDLSSLDVTQVRNARRKDIDGEHAQ